MLSLSLSVLARFTLLSLATAKLWWRLIWSAPVEPEACVSARTDCDRGSYGWSLFAWRGDFVCFTVHRAGAALSLAGSGLRRPDRRRSGWFSWCGVIWAKTGSQVIITTIMRIILTARTTPPSPSSSRHHDHSHDHGHTQNHHDVNQQVSHRELLTLGISGGIVPCPAALVVLLSAVSMQRIGFGLLLIVAFSVGLAAVLITIGLLMVYARQFMSRFQVDGRLTTRWLPLTSSAFILALRHRA